MLQCKTVSSILTPWSLLLLVSVLPTERCTNRICARWILRLAGTRPRQGRVRKKQHTNGMKKWRVNKCVSNQPGPPKSGKARKPHKTKKYSNNKLQQLCLLSLHIPIFARIQTPPRPDLAKCKSQELNAAEHRPLYGKYLKKYHVQFCKLIRRSLGPPPGTDWSVPSHDILHDWNRRIGHWSRA